MGMDVNDIKVLMNSGFQYLMKTCYQWAKDHPLVSGVLLFFYLLYIFLPYIFSILFYSFPLVVCTAILLGGSRISHEKHPKNTKKEDEETSSCNAISTAHNRRPNLQSQMSRRTFGKDKSKDKDHIEGFPRKDDPNMHISSILEEEIFPMKKMCPSLEVTNTTLESPILENDGNNGPGVGPAEEAESGEIRMYAALPVTGSETVNENCISEKALSLLRGASSSSDMESDDDEPQEETEKAVQWTEDDQRNLIDLGSSEIERNKRLESLMEKRKAKKILSMQPRRTPMDYLGNYYPFDHHIDRVGSVMLARHRVHRNPFDIPYDPHEERPVLRGGSFEEEFFEELLKDMPLRSHEGFNFAGANNYFGHFKDEPAPKSIPCLIPKPMPPDKPGFSRFKRESDVEDNVNEEVSIEGRKDEDLGMKDKEEENPASSSSSLSSNRSRKSSSDSSRESSRKKTRKRETCRSSEGKGLTCLVAPRKNKVRHTGKEKVSTSSSSNVVVEVSRTISNAPSKMEERSYYTSRPRHHRHSCSLASDMQVEVSEAESPTLDLPSPTDCESLVYDADVDRDANSGDEDFWGTSPHPMRLGSFGAKSRLPEIVEDNNNNRVLQNSTAPPHTNERVNEGEIGDKKSTNGEIIESRTSVSFSSSSESLDSQMQGKSQHLADYLACLDVREVDSNTLEVPSTSHVQEGSAEEITVQEESKGIFEMEEDKEESKRNNERAHFKGRSQLSKESSSASNDCICIEGDIAPFVAEPNEQSRRLEEAHAPTSVLEKGVTEVNPKEVISDSLSTTSHDDVGDRAKSGEEPHAKSEKEVKTMSGNQVEGEVKPESPSIIHEECTSTSLEKANGEANHVVYDANKSDIDRETSNKSKDSSLKIEDETQLVTTKEEANMEQPSSTNTNETSK